MACWVKCPICQDDEPSVAYRIKSTYDSETNSGGGFEYDETDCGCDLSTLTADQWEALDAEVDKLVRKDPMAYDDDPFDDW